VPAETDRLLYAVDLAGTLFFGIEGAMAAIGGNLDLLGLLVLACATAFGGGIIRDLLIGDIPPASLRDWRYVAVAVAGGASAFFLHSKVEETPRVVAHLGGRRRFGAVRGCRNGKGAAVQDAPVHCRVDGHDYGSGRRSCARRFAGASAARAASRRVCHGGARGRGDHACGPESAAFSNVGGGAWRYSMFSFAHDQCLASLEFTKGRRRVSCGERFASKRN
jgi:hypothetical protein